MKQIPIIMSGDHPLKCLDGTKTQTRRVIVPQPELIYGVWDYCRPSRRGPHVTATIQWSEMLYPPPELLSYCPYGGVGDRLWVRETWATEKHLDYLPPSKLGEAATLPLWYRAGNNKFPPHSLLQLGKWRPSIHMPQWASRILLEIAEVRVERLQEITEEDAKAEGFKSREDFRHYWNLLHAKWKRVYNKELKIYEFWQFPWCAEDAKPIPKNTKHPERYHCYPNPWVWVISFKKLEGECS